MEGHLQITSQLFADLNSQCILGRLQCCRGWKKIDPAKRGVITANAQHPKGDGNFGLIVHA